MENVLTTHDNTGRWYFMENIKNNNQKSDNVLDTLQSYKKPMTLVDVEIRPSELFGDAARYAILSAQRIFRFSENAPVVDHDTLTKYFVDALVHRIALVRGEKMSPVLKRRQRFYPLPAVVYNAIRQIGEAKDCKFNIKFTPTLDPAVISKYSAKKAPSDEAIQEVAVSSVKEMKYIPLSDEDFNDVVAMFAAMENEGYVCSEALSKDIYGDINVMAMTNVENKTQGPESYAGQSPVFAFYRAFFYNKQLEYLTEAVFTYRYNTMEEMAMVLKELTLGNVNAKTLTEVKSEFR